MIHIAPILILAVIFGGIALILYVSASFKLRNKILNAGKLELEPNQIKALFEDIELSKTTPLKWGLILFFGGLGLIVINYLSVDINSTLPWGIEIVALSLGYLIYYVLTKAKEVSSPVRKSES